ncbi:dynein axonemal assembly factor 3-like [Halichondria panicea]|uniref:dynein axonemal assembly factor 3-like n=1 Tax=Halichondria panicea TaxID=6063 RepID=UPI00312BA85E
MAANIDGFGAVTWWGFSPALDLGDLKQKGIAKQGPATDPPTVQSDVVNVLLVGAADLRHVFKTLVHSHKYTNKPVHFYVAEGCLEVYARHLLFLSLLFEPSEKMGLQERVELFLELYGNTLVRPATADYLREKASQLIKMVTDEEYLKQCVPILDISLLKYKERDFLESIFKFWRNRDEKYFDVAKLWEHRLRQYLGQRYDSRSGAFDWDYNMHLSDMAPVVGSREYQGWREGGVAFRLRGDAPYTSSNMTLASGLLLKEGADKVARRGYWGDIVSSPYLSFGVESHNEELFTRHNGRHIKTSSDVSEYNLLSLFHRLITGEEYAPPTTTAEQETSQMGVIEEIDEEQEAVINDKTPGSEHSLRGPLFNGSCSVTLLPLNSPSEIGRKEKFKQLFDVVYLSNSMVHHLASGIHTTFSPGCTLVMETAKFMLDLKKDKRVEYVQKITSMATSVGFKIPVLPSEDNPSHLAFIRDT